MASFPEKLKVILAGLTDDELNEAAVSWSAIEKLSGADFNVIKNLLYEIRDLAKRADSSDKDILIRMSL